MSWNDLLFGRKSIFGIDIVEVPVLYVPKLKLSDDAPVSDEFRKEFNSWLLNEFGQREYCPVPINKAFMIGGTVLMRPESVVKLTNFCA